MEVKRALNKTLCKTHTLNIMKFIRESIALFCWLSGVPNAVDSFSLRPYNIVTLTNTISSTTSLKVSIGIGPSEEEQKQLAEKRAKEEKFVEEPNHELFRDSRLTDFDKQCDEWFGNLLQSDAPSFLGTVSEEALKRLNTLCPLEREVCICFDEVLHCFILADTYTCIYHLTRISLVFRFAFLYVAKI
jgi:hypothetical protein